MELLAYKRSLLLLARFFHLYPEPSARSLELLSRWYWRASMTGIIGDESLQWLRESMRLMKQGEEPTVRELLNRVPSSTRGEAIDLTVPYSWKRVTRLWVNALVALQPRELLTGQRVDITGLLEQRGKDALIPIFTEPLERRDSLVNQLFHPDLKRASVLAVLQSYSPREPEVLLSHGIQQEGYEALRRGQYGEFLTSREHFLRGHIERFLAAKARWGESDRGSLQSLIVTEEED